jgi:beta-lactamase regulating signal transducer with metallopeptidase domain
VSRLLIFYLFSLGVRSLAIAGLAGFLTVRVRSASLRHAVWAAVLGCVVLMPVADAVLPSALVPAPLQTIALPVQTFVIFVPQAEIAEAPPAQTVMTVAPRNWWLAATVLITLVAAALLVRMALAYFAIWRMRQLSSRVTAGVLAGIAIERGFRTRQIEIRESEAVTVPLTVGLWKPALVLPSGWQTWEDWKLRAVLYHEMTHVRRCDWAMAMVASGARCILWFNPLAWWLERKLSVLSEEACDEASVWWTGDAPRYAETLLHFASAAKHGHRWIGGVAMAQHRIGSRIERVLALRTPGRGIVSNAAWLGLTLLAAGTLYAAAAAQSAARMEGPSRTPPEILRAVEQAPMPEARQVAIVQRSPQPGPVVNLPQSPAERQEVGTPVTTTNTEPAAPVPDAIQIQTRTGTNRYTGTAVWNVRQQPQVINPDLVGEIRLILTPVDAQAGGGNAPAQGQYPGPIIRNKEFFYMLWQQNLAGGQLQDGYTFGITGVQGRTVLFADTLGGTFSYGCPDCSFLVWEQGVGGTSTNAAPGIAFKVSADGKSLSVTCRATECRIGNRFVAIVSDSAALEYKPLLNGETTEVPLSQDTTPVSIDALRTCFTGGLTDGTVSLLKKDCSLPFPVFSFTTK